MNDGSHFDRQRAAEQHEAAERAHETGQEHSKRALEHSQQAYHEGQKLIGGAQAAHGIVSFGHDEIAALAHQLWNAKGRPDGKADEDWFQAAQELRGRAETRSKSNGYCGSAPATQ